MCNRISFKDSVIVEPVMMLTADYERAIWPGILRLPDGNTAELRSARNRMMHNMNAVFALSEACLLSGLPVRWSDAALAPLWGVAYVLFSWAMTHRWNDVRQHGPQFIYFFFDTTLPGYMVTKALLLLLFVQMVFYGLFCSASALLTWLDGGVATHVLFVVVAASMVMRFRD